MNLANDGFDLDGACAQHVLQHRRSDTHPLLAGWRAADEECRLDRGRSRREIDVISTRDGCHFINQADGQASDVRSSVKVVDG
jgi:hypothetical protein